MRAAALALTAVLGLGAPATAGEVSGVEIIEYGLYTADVTGQLRDSNGIISNVIENLCHIATTTTVPMNERLHFGFRYRVVGPVPGDTVQLTLAVRFPAAVQPNPKVGPLTEHERGTTLSIGAVSYTGYSFDQAWEFVPGTWILAVRQGGRTLAEKSFTVVDSGEPPVSAGPSSCFKVSSL
ncbi:DUF3859 domain-containing protein [Reyranella sp.]|uniref:DUF3859 domain-containing protein n=1 Tax=Reyranella sp. TaxID=1929291 RepID=UPI003D0A3A53